MSTFDPAYILELADLVDPDRLWRLAGIDQLDLPDDKRRQLDAGVCLRRHASHLERLSEVRGLGKSLLITSLSPNSSASMHVDIPDRHLELLKGHTMRPLSIPDLPEAGEQAFPGTSDTRTPQEVSDYIKAENAEPLRCQGCGQTMAQHDRMARCPTVPSADSEGGEL